jgi:hypothetical protein
MKKKFRKKQSTTEGIASELKINLNQEMDYGKQLDVIGIKSTAINRLQKFQMKS